MKHVIIGGVAGGATAAARIRRADEFAEIVLLERSPYISYANCGLPYYIGGTITERNKLFVQTPQAFSRRFNIDVRVENEVLHINVAMKTIRVRRADGSEYDESYDRLLLSPGAEAVRPPLEGIDIEGIFTLRNVSDTDQIKHFMNTHTVRRAVVVGGGFIGLEMAENLHDAGAQVSIVEMGSQVMAPVDFSIASHVHAHLMDKGVGLYLEKGVERFEKNGDQIDVCLSDGGRLTADVVLLSIGVRPSVRLAQEAGIELGERGIKVNEYLETSAKDIYAVGDAIEFTHPLTGTPWLNFLANPANRQGRIVADNMVKGNCTPYEGAIGTSIAKVFDLAIGSTGLPAKQLKRLGINYLSSWTISSSHAGYYPGSFPITTKLTFDPKTGKLLGGQCVGSEGVDKRIDQLALVIKHGGTVEDLIRLEHAYAPPFSSAKDPIAIAGYAAANIISGEMPTLTWRELNRMDKSAITLLDVRTPAEFEMGTIEGAKNIPLDDLRERISEIPADRPVVIFCAVGLRGYLALRILKAHGYDVKNLSGGYKIYALAMQKTEAKRQTPAACQTPCQCVPTSTIRIDACGLQCPGPIMKLKQAMDTAEAGTRIEVVATDAGFSRDAEAWCTSTGNKFVSRQSENGYHTVIIEKGNGGQTCATTNDGKTLIMFSDDLDKALATFVLANGAAATGKKVSIFFTFWGLNVIKKERKPAVQKDIFGRMFNWMLPSHSKRLSLSKMSMLGMGDRMMRYLMGKKHINSLEELRQEAIDSGVEFIACQMSMDMMGIQKEELLDNVTIGGVATYMERAEKSNVNLFI